MFLINGNKGIKEKNKEKEMEINLIHKRKGGVSHLYVCLAQSTPKDQSCTFKWFPYLFLSVT